MQSVSRINSVKSTLDPENRSVKSIENEVTLSWEKNLFNFTEPIILPVFSSNRIKLPKALDTRSVYHLYKNYASFYYSILAKTLKSKNKIVKAQIDFNKYFNMEGMHIPMRMCDISLFEKNNNLSINVFGLNNKYQIIGPYYHTKKAKLNHTNLLYVTEENGYEHYCYIKWLGKLLYNQLPRLPKFNYHVCNNCFMTFKKSHHLGDHNIKDCRAVNVILPPKNAKYISTECSSKSKKV